MTRARRPGRARTRITPPADQVSTTLIYPMHLVTGAQTNAGLAITLNQFVPTGQPAFLYRDASGTDRVAIPPAGGPKTNATDFRAHNTDTGSYVAFRGQSAPPCVELPDGPSAQGLRLWSGTGFPGASTVQNAHVRVGDYYIRRRTGAVTAVLYVCTVAGSPPTWVQVI